MRELARAIARDRVWVLLAVFFASTASVAIVIPHIQAVASDYFASQALGQPVVCSDIALEDRPQECVAGADRNVQWTAGTSFVANAVLGFLLVPLTGTLSDKWGRKPFFLLGQALSALPILWITAYLRSPANVSLLPYYALSTLRGAVDTMPVVLSASADALAPQHRAGMFTVLLACISLAFVIGSAVGGPMAPRGAATLSSALLLAVGVVTVLFVPETRRSAPEPSSPAKADAARASAALEEPRASFLTTARDSFAVICRSRLFLQLAAIIALSGMAMECLQDLLFNYLQVTLAFGAQGLAAILAELGIGGFLCQIVVAPLMLRLSSQKAILVVAMVASTIEMGMLAAAPSTGRAVAYTGIAVGTLGSMAFPIVSALKSFNASQEEQGKVQGALFGVRALARGVGPLVFSAMFHFFSQQPHYHPSAPLWGLTLVSAGGAAVALFVHVPEAADGAVKAAFAEDGEALLASNGGSDAEATTSHESGGPHSHASASSSPFEERSRARAASVQLSSWFSPAKMPQTLADPPRPQTAIQQSDPTRVSVNNRQTSATLSRRIASVDESAR